MPKVTSYNKGSIIYFEGDKDDKVYILQKGHVMLAGIDIETKRSTMTILKEGEFFGIKSALGRCPREETVTAVEQAVCIVFTIPEFESYFKSNKALIMKMLKIFSKELKTVHRKTSDILKIERQDASQGLSINDEGLFSVAKSFYEDEKWRSCFGACSKLLKQNPNYSTNREFVGMLKKSKVEMDNLSKKEEAEKHRMILSGEYDENGKNGLSSDYQSESTEKAFDLPAFARFAKTYNDGEIIIAEFEKGETFYLIQKGLVQLTKCVNGSNKNLDILNPGELFGEMAILDNSPRSATCVAKGKVDCLEFNKENFEILVTGNPQIALMLLRLFCKRVLDQNRRLKILTLDDVQARLADVFCMFDETGSLPPVQVINDEIKKPSPNRRVFPLTINDLAHWAGLSLQQAREEASKMMSKHLITIFDSYMIVENINDMKRIVDNRVKIMNKQ